MVYELGICCKDIIDIYYIVECYEYVWFCYVVRYLEDGKLVYEFWYNCDFLIYVLLFDNIVGIMVDFIYGLLVDMRWRKWIIVDVGK